MHVHSLLHNTPPQQHPANLDVLGYDDEIGQLALLQA
ncbi:MAG: hypothetical protein K0R28_7036, partial [Paenibacillus sp.]|nr:hypothetical protein [Paenibacillus sp.]